MVAVRRIIVIEDGDLREAVQNEEATLDDIEEYLEADNVVSYQLRVTTEVDATTICHALQIEPTSEHELSDADHTIYLWDPQDGKRAGEAIRTKRTDARNLAALLCEAVRQQLELEVASNVDEVLDVLEQPDRGYQPAPTADPAVSAAALLMRHASAFNAAKRRNAWVLSM